MNWPVTLFFSSTARVTWSPSPACRMHDRGYDSSLLVTAPPKCLRAQVALVLSPVQGLPYSTKSEIPRMVSGSSSAATVPGKVESLGLDFMWPARPENQKEYARPVLICILSWRRHFDT